MSGADLLVDGFPHGTKDGYKQGCRGSACPSALEFGISCRDAHMRYQGDWSYRRRVDAGATVKEIAAADAAERPQPKQKKAEPVPAELVSSTSERPVRVKPKTTRRGLRDSDFGIPLDEEQTVFPETRVRPVPKPSVPTIKPADLVRPVQEVEDKVSEPKVIPVEKHGTANGYKAGCRDDNCPGVERAGKSCRTAVAEYQREYNARKKATEQARAGSSGDGSASEGDHAAPEISEPQAGVQPSDAEGPADADQEFLKHFGSREYSDMAAERDGDRSELTFVYSDREPEPPQPSEIVGVAVVYPSGAEGESQVGDRVEFHEVPQKDPIEGVGVFEGRVPTEVADDFHEAVEKFVDVGGPEAADGVAVAAAEVERAQREALVEHPGSLAHGGLFADLKTTRRQRDEAREENARLREQLGALTADLTAAREALANARADAELRALGGDRMQFVAGEELEVHLPVTVQVSFEEGRLSGVRVEIPSA